MLDLSKEELEAYRKFEKALQKDYVGVRHRLLTAKGSHTMAVLTLLSKFRQVPQVGTDRLLRDVVSFVLQLIKGLTLAGS